MTTWLDDLAQYLEDSTDSIGVFSPTSTQTRSIYTLNAPSTDTSHVILYPYAGMSPDWTLYSSGYYCPRLNVLVVSTAADGGLQKSIDIRTRLNHVANVGLPTSTVARLYRHIYPLGDPEWLGKDESGRGQFVINFQVEYS